MYSGVYGVYYLISSIHIKGGIGTTALAISFGSSILPPLVLPFFMNKFGIRSLLITASIAYLLFVIGNAHSSHVTVILAGIFYAVGCNLGWPTTALTNVYFAKSQQHLNPERKLSDFSKRYFGMFFAVVSLGNGIGNGVVYFILATDRKMILSQNASSLDGSVCGVNDCQDTNTTHLYISQYTPSSASTQYVVVATCAIFVSIAAFVFYLILPQQESVVVGTQQEKDHLYTSDSVITQLSSKTCKMLFSTPLEVFRFLFSVKQLCVVLLPIYNGMSNAMVASEISRAFASCILGLDNVSLCFVIYATSNLVSSYAFGLLAGKYGRNIPLLVGFLVDQSLYLICLFLEPTEIENWNVYLLFVGFGLTQGIWLPVTAELYTDYFKNKRNIAVTVHNLMMMVGGLFVVATSTYLCMSTKLYIHITVLSLAVVLYKIGTIKDDQTLNCEQNICT